MPLYPKLSNQAIVRSKGFDPDVPSPLGQAFTRRMIEQQQADIKAKDMKLSPLDRAVAGLESAMMMGSMMFESIQQAPKLLQGEDAYATAIGNRVYQPRMQPEKSAEYIGNVIDLMDKAQTDYKIPPLIPELAGFQSLMGAANQQVKQGVNRTATNAGMALERSLDKPVTDIMNRGGFGAQMLGSFDTQPARVMKEKGGNWLGGNLAGGVDRRLKSLQTQDRQISPLFLEDWRQDVKNPSTRDLSDEDVAMTKRRLNEHDTENAVNQWVEKNVGNYVKKEMGTPEDPVRLMLEKRAQEIEAQFQVDMNRARRTLAKAEVETDPDKRANLMRRADQQGIDAKADKDFANNYATHFPPDEYRPDEDALTNLKDRRIAQGFDPEGMAQSEPAKQWENISDEAIDVIRAGDIQKQQAMQEQSRQANLAYDKIFNEVEERFPVEFRKELEEKGVTLDDQQYMNIIKSMPFDEKASFLGIKDEFQKLRQESFNADRMFSSGLQEMGEENPFVAKLDPETKLYQAYLGDLGIDHVVDVIKQDVAAGRIRPEQLNKLTMDQAIRRTADYNKELAQKMNAEKAAAREGLPVYKEYPEGYRWIELNKPGAFLAESDAMGHSVKGYEPPKGHPDWFEGSGDSGSLRYGYGGWEGIKSGDAKVYSLVNKKGEPHVTVESKRGKHPIGYSYSGGETDFPDKFDYNNDYLDGSPRLAPEQKTAILNRAKALHSENPKMERMNAFQQAANEIIGELPLEITQIKGKGNAKPVADYLPFVQDFVKSGQWSDVGDFQNTGLKRIETVPERERFKSAGMNLPQYLTDAEHHQLIDEYNKLTKPATDMDFMAKEYGFPPPEGMKAGGKVHVSDNPDTMAMELEDRKYQVGGIVDIAARAAKAAKAAQLKQAMKASEALAQIEGKRLNITQADRTKVGQGFLGGPGFSGLQRQEGPHKDVGAVWGVKNVGTAKTMLGGFDKPLGKEYFTTMIGSPTQHQSNQMVFDKLYNQFKSEAKKGNLDPELRDKINARLAASVDKDGNPIFPSDIDILDKNFKKQATTFDQRAVTGNVLGGVGVGGRKGQIFDYDKIIRDTTDPFLLDAPSGSMGYRLWTPSGEIIERPDLHPAFPAIATGEDLGVEFNPAAQDILMEPWVQNIRETKGKNPGYMDWTRGRPPSVEVSEDILTNLQKSGNKEGGLIKVKRKAKAIKKVAEVKKAQGGEITGDDLILTERPL